MKSFFSKFPAALLIVFVYVFPAFGQQTESDQGIGLYDKGDFQAAIRVLKQSDAVRDLYYLGLAYEKTGERGKAEDAFKKSFAGSYEIFRKTVDEWQKFPGSEKKQSFSALLQKSESSNLAGLTAAEKLYSLDPGFFQNEWRVKAGLLADLKDLAETRSEIYMSSDNLTSRIQITESPRLRTPRDIRDIPYMRHTQTMGKPIVVKFLVIFGADEKIKLAFPIDALIDPYTFEGLKTIRGMKFKPATKDNKPVDYCHRLEFSFTV